MTKPPACIVTAESDLDSLIHTEMDSKEDIIAYGELLVEVRAKRDSMEVTKSFDKGIDSEMGTAKAGIAIELKDMNSNGEGWKVWSTRYESLTSKFHRYTKISLMKSDLPVTKKLLMNKREIDQGIQLTIGIQYFNGVVFLKFKR